MPWSSDSTSTNLPSSHPRGIWHLLERRPQGCHGSVLGRDHPGSGKTGREFGRKKAAASLRYLHLITRNERFPKTSSKAFRSHISASLIQYKIFGSVLEKGKKGEMEQLIFDYRNFFYHLTAFPNRYSQPFTCWIWSNSCTSLYAALKIVKRKEGRKLTIKHISEKRWLSVLFLPHPTLNIYT